MKPKPLLIMLVALSCLGLGVIHFFGAQLGFLGSFADQQHPGIVSSASYLRVIEEKQNLDRVYSAYYVLGERADPIALDVALEDVHSEDDYLWLNAGHYLGLLGREEAVPYLIKGLRHTASKSDAERIELLQQLTGKTDENDFTAWQSWWMSEHPDSTLDWSSSLGSQPRAP